jgi:hypothetical protein
MTTTTFTASVVSSSVSGIMGPLDRKTRITLAFPQQWTAAGLALDLSGSTLGAYSYISEYSFGPGSLITDGEIYPHLFGTKHASDGSISASTVKVGAHWGGGAGAALDSVGTDDLSAIVALALTVHGY